MRRKLFAALIALLAILFVAAPPPVIADTKSGSEPILTVTITSGDIDTTLFAVMFWARDDTESAMATWTSFQRGDGLTIAATAIPVTVSPLGSAMATLRGPTDNISGSPHWRLANCTGTGTAHDDGKGTDTRKPTALIASGGLLGQPLRR